MTVSQKEFTTFRLIRECFGLLLNFVASIILPVLIWRKYDALLGITSLFAMQMIFFIWAEANVQSLKREFKA